MLCLSVGHVIHGAGVGVHAAETFPRQRACGLCKGSAVRFHDWSQIIADRRYLPILGKAVVEEAVEAT